MKFATFITFSAAAVAFSGCASLPPSPASYIQESGEYASIAIAGVRPGDIVKVYGETCKSISRGNSSGLSGRCLRRFLANVIVVKMLSSERALIERPKPPSTGESLVFEKADSNSSL